MSVAARLPAADRPVVTGDDAFANQQFTTDHPGRRYLRRPAADGSVWLIRRQGRAYLRTLARLTLLRVAWFEAAWAEIDKPTRDALIKAARTAERVTKAPHRPPTVPTSPPTDTNNTQNGGSP